MMGTLVLSFEKIEFFSFFLMRKRLFSGQKCFLRPYFPLNWCIFVLGSGPKFSFRALKVAEPRVKKRSFSLTKITLSSYQFRHPKSPYQKHIFLIHLLNTEKGVPSEYPGSHITERNIKTGNQCKSGQKSCEKERKLLHILIAVQTNSAK